MLRKIFSRSNFASKRWFSEALEAVAQKPLFNAELVNPEDYRDLDQKVKYKTGYAIMEVEPFPRLKIMEIGLHILAKLKKEIPATAFYRIYTEEYVKYVMEITHETPNVKLLEKKIGIDCIEMFIESFAMEVVAVDGMKVAKPWIDQQTEEDIATWEMLKVPHDEHLRFESLPPTQKPTLLKK